MSATGEQVKAAMIAARINAIPHHDCALCGAWVQYFRRGDRLYFDSSCDCASSPPRPCDWDEAARWINMQSSAEIRNLIRAKFGMPPEPPA